MESLLTRALPSLDLFSTGNQPMSSPPERRSRMERDLPMLLVRIAVGIFYLLEGALKFAQPEHFGVEHFLSLGIPFAQTLAPVTGVIEIVGGLMLLTGYYAGEAAIVFILLMICAVVSTKLPVLFGRDLGPFRLLPLPHYGWASFFHEVRVEALLILANLAILLDRDLRIGRPERWYEATHYRRYD